MDYSSIHENEDLQAGSSPWASSPQQSRTNLPPGSNEVPPSPPQASLGPAAPESPATPRQDDQVGEPTIYSPQPTRPAQTSSSIPYREQPDAAQQDDSLPQPQPQHDQRAPDGHQRHQGHDGQQQPRQQRQRPRYTMTAKITGLERSGRKDPMFRFDIHVSISLASSNNGTLW